MAKFTKLNIGDTVASSSGRVWKKLSVELVASTGIRLLTSDGYVLTDLNGIIITTKEK